MASRTVNGFSDESPYEEISGEHLISRQDVITKGPMAFIENIHQAAEQIMRQKVQLLFEKLREVTSKTGNIVDEKGQPFTFDTFMRSLEKVQIEFDDQGNPLLPTFVASPELASRLTQSLPKWMADQKNKKRFDELIETKKKEWHDRESDRKLVD